MKKLIWNNIVRRKNQSILTVMITLMTVFIFVLVLGVFVTMKQGLDLSRERLGADVVILPEEANVDGYELLLPQIRKMFTWMHLCWKKSQSRKVLRLFHRSSIPRR